MIARTVDGLQYLQRNEGVVSCVPERAKQLRCPNTIIHAVYRSEQTSGQPSLSH